MPLSPLAAVAAEQNPANISITSPSNKTRKNNTNSSKNPSNLSKNSTVNDVDLESTTNSTLSLSQVALTDHDIIAQSRESLLNRYTEFKWNDPVSSLLPYLPMSIYDYYMELTPPKKQQLQVIIHDRYTAAVDHALIRYSKTLSDAKAYKVFAKDINQLRLQMRSTIDENMKGGKLNIPSIIKNTLQEWMIKDGLIKPGNTSISSNTKYSSSPNKYKQIDKIDIPANWLPDNTTKANTSSSSSSSLIIPNQPNNPQSSIRSTNDNTKISNNHLQSIDNKHDTYHHIETWENYPKDYEWSLLRRSQQQTKSSIQRQISTSTNKHDVATSDEPTFWVGRTIGLGGIQSNFTGGGNSGSNTVRKKHDPGTMRALWAAERGIISTLPNLESGLEAALEKNELRILDPAGANLASIMGPAETSQAYIEIAKNRWHREPTTLVMDSSINHETLQNNHIHPLYDPLNIPLSQSSNATVRSIFTNAVQEDNPSSSSSITSISTITENNNVSLANISGRITGYQLRSNLAQKTEIMNQKLALAGAVPEDSLISTNNEALALLPSSENDLLPYQQPSQPNISLPIGTRLLVDEHVPGVISRISQPKEGVISITVDNLTDNKDTRNPLREEANPEFHDGKIESISYIPILPQTDTVPSDTKESNSEAVETTADETVTISQSRTGSAAPKIIPILESSDFSSFISNQLNAKVHQNQITSLSNNGPKTMIKGPLTSQTVMIPSAIYRDPKVAQHLAKAARPLPAVDHINIHAINRLAAKAQGNDRPNTPRTLNDSIDYRYGKVNIEKQPPPLTAATTSTTGRSITSQNLVTSPISIKSMYDNNHQDPWYYKQGYVPGIALNKTNPSSTAALIGPVAAEKLRKEANVQDASDYLLHRVIGTRAGAPHRSRQMNRSVKGTRVKEISPSPVDILQSFANTGKHTGRDLHSSPSMEDTSVYSMETNSTMLLNNALDRSDQFTHDQQRIAPSYHHYHQPMNNNQDNNDNDDILDPKVHTSLAELSSVLLKSQALPVTYAMRVRGLGALNASRPLPFKLSPIEPRKPISLKKKNMYESMFLEQMNNM